MSKSVVLDGSVLCGVDAGKSFDYGRLRAAIRDTRTACGSGPSTVKVFVDASLRWKLNASDKKDLEQDIASGTVEQTPAGLEADVFILRWAAAHGAIVVTNDLYRKWVQDFPWISDTGSGRFVSGVYDTQLKNWTFLERHSNGTPRTLESLLGSTVKIPVDDKFTDPTVEKYKQAITRNLPTAVLFLLDQSGSMNDNWSEGQRKSETLASFVNDTLYELVLTCTRQDGVRPYVDVAIIGYGGSEVNGVRSELPTTTFKEPFLDISEVEKHHRMVEHGEGESTVMQPIWITPRAEGGTPMTKAMTVAEAAVKKWVENHPSSFPPIVFNITDGESTDGDPTDIASKLTSHATSDGNTLLFTAHISNQTAQALQYPEFLDTAVGPNARRMFNMSSHVPSSMRSMAAEMGIKISPASRGFLFNATASDVVGMLNVGSPATRPIDRQA